MSKARRKSASSGIGRPKGQPPRRKRKREEDKCPTSGIFVISGDPTDCAFMVGEDVARPTALAFQLAPRIYVLSLEGRRKRFAGALAHLLDALEHLPLHLVFQESMKTGGERHQRWVSETHGGWVWELVVEHRDRAVAVSLEACHVEDRGRRHRWKARAGWAAFGDNGLDADSPGSAAPSLLVTAP